MNGNGSAAAARCLMCGKTYQIADDHKDYEKLQAQGSNATFICDQCSHKVRYEPRNRISQKAHVRGEHFGDCIQRTGGNCPPFFLPLNQSRAL